MPANTTIIATYSWQETDGAPHHSQILGELLIDFQQALAEPDCAGPCTLEDDGRG